MDLFSLDASPCAHLRIGLDDRIFYANAAMETLAGRSNAELVSLRFRELLPPAGVIFYDTQFLPALRLRRSVRELSFDILSPGQQRVPVIVSAALETDASGIPVSALIALFDATQRRRYEAELLKARRDFEQMADVVRLSSDAILQLTPLREIRSWNEGAKKIFGYTSKEAVGQQLRLLFTEAAEQETAEALSRLADGLDTDCETTGRRKDGSIVSIFISLTPHLEPPGRLVGFSAIIRDIAERKTAERALMQAEKLTSVGRLASSIAHELNNPLAAVTNLLYLLHTGAKDEETRALVIAAESELARVSHIATHTLRFHRQSSKKSRVEMRELFAEATSLYQGRFADAGIRTLMDCRSEPLECYEGELRQVLVHLLSNAFDAMRHGGTLTLRASNTKRWPTGDPGIRISVGDDGTGMSPEACEHLFEPFFSTKGINGAGLGLWISKDLVTKNGGSIRLRSNTRPDACGTVVSMLFPAPW